MQFKIKRTEYKIEVDVYQYTLSRLYKNTWIVLGYYNDIHYLLLKLLKLGCMEVKKVNDIEEMIKKSLSILKTSILSQFEGGRRNDLPEGNGKVVGGENNG